MAQIVHDLAPGAGLSFATAFLGEASFASNIRGLAAAGASVIADDVAYLEEPFFQDGPVARAIDEVVAGGASYFTAAGNDNLFEEAPVGSNSFNGNEISSWEAPEFRDATGAGCPAQLNAALPYEVENCLDFDPSEATEDNTFGITVSPESTLLVDLQWAEPWDGVEADLDAYLLDESGKPIVREVEGKEIVVGSTQDNVSGTKRPVEIVSWKNESSEARTVQLVVNRCFSSEEEMEEEAGCNPFADPTRKPRLKLILVQNGAGVAATEYPQSAGGDVVGPAIYGHAGAAAAVSVGAVHAGVTDSPEPYTSRGPVTHYFGPVRAGSPAPPLTEAIPKPDVAATDCGRTTFFYTEVSGSYFFCGTSAAAPHAAAVAALARQANPSLTPAQIQSGLALTARPVGAFGPDAVGGGLLDAHRMLEDLTLPPRVTIVDRPPPLGNDPRPSVSFTASRPVSFACSVDGAAPVPCSSPFTPAARLADGSHVFTVEGRDLAGRVGVGEPVSFAIDTVAPRTRFRHRPRRKVRTRRRRARAVFVLASNEPGSRFTCRVDRGPGALLRAALRQALPAGSPRGCGEGDRPCGQRRPLAGPVPLQGGAAGPPSRPPLTFPPRPLTGAARSCARRAAAPAARPRCPAPAGRSARGPRGACRSRPPAR